MFNYLIAQGYEFSISILVSRTQKNEQRRWRIFVFILFFFKWKDGEMDNIKPRCHIGKINSTLST
jgi:hypothetical protein